MNDLFFDMFLTWLAKTYPDKQELVFEALCKWCAEYELEWFENLYKKEQLLALLHGELPSGFTSYKMRDLLHIYGEELDETILEKLGTSIEIARWLGEYKEYTLSNQ